MALRLNRYSAWDGTQNTELDADQIMKALSDDLMEFGDLQQAMRYLMQRGMDTENGDNMRGLRELLQQLKDERRQRLERFDIDSTMEDIRRQLNEILDMEKKTINDWIDRTRSPDHAQEFIESLGEGLTKNSLPEEASAESEKNSYSDQLLSSIGEKNYEFIKNLPDDSASMINALQDYEFLNTDAQKKFLKFINHLRKAMTRSLFKNISRMIDQISEGDIKRMKEMIKDLNEMLVKKIAGEDADFNSFMEKHGDMFGDSPPQSLDKFLNQIQQQMSVTQSLVNSMSTDQQHQLQAMMHGKFGDTDLDNELAKLTKELDFLNPQGKEYNFSGNEEIDLLAAMELMQELSKLDQLEQQMQHAQYNGKVDNIDHDMIRELLGDEALVDLEKMSSMLKTMENAGYVRKEGNKWGLTPRGTRSLGQKALDEIYNKLKKQSLGNHAVPEEGRFGERTEESKPYEFGDAFHLHMPRTIRNSVDRDGPGTPIKLRSEDFEVYQSELITQTATVLMVDLSWSMALRGSFQSAKKVAMALHNLISSAYPQDSLYILGFSAYAREIKPYDLPYLQYDDYLLGTNIQHALILAGKLLARHRQGTRQVVMITDGEPTAHLENSRPVFAYPPTPTTISKTLRAVKNCTSKNITINTFMLDKNHYLKAFVENMSRINGGRIFYAEPQNLGEYILVDYVKNKKKRLARL